MTPEMTKVIGSVTPVVIIIGVMALRMRRLMQTRPLKLETLWIRPTILIVLSGLLMAAAPPKSLTDVAILLVPLAVGAAIGWRQGKLMAIGIEPESHKLNVKASPVAVLIFGGILIVRVGLRSVLTAEASAWHLNIGLVLDALLMLVVGLYVAQAIEMYLRASAMLKAAKRGGAIVE